MLVKKVMCCGETFMYSYENADKAICDYCHGNLEEKWRNLEEKWPNKLLESAARNSEQQSNKKILLLKRKI
jgi:hypothetical protein